ncbi:MAG: hypothetical protein AAB037_07135, partial [Chloroflexota bacterium]
WILSGGVAFFLLGLLDDLHHLPEWIRLLIEASVSLIIAACGPRLLTLNLPGLSPWAMPVILSVLVTAFWYTGFINLFNFMDGTDGLAAGEAALVGFLMAIVGGGAWPLIVSASALGFLFFNHQPSRIFMGDSGSYLLGFLLAVLSVIGCRTASAHVVFQVFLLFQATFIIDTTVTLARRICFREDWFKAHRSHYYQKLSDLGWSHARIAWSNLGITACLGASGIAYIHLPPVGQIILLTAWSTAFGAGILLIHHYEAS